MKKTGIIFFIFLIHFLPSTAAIHSSASVNLSEKKDLRLKNDGLLFTINSNSRLVLYPTSFDQSLAALKSSSLVNTQVPPVPSRMTNAYTEGYPLFIVTTSLTGSLFSFTGFDGFIEGGTFTYNPSTYPPYPAENFVLRNAQVVQDFNNIATGTMLLLFNNGSTFPVYNVAMSNAIIQNVVAHGDIVSDSGTEVFTGAYFFSLNPNNNIITQAEFDLIVLAFPPGTVFNIDTGDLGPTGTFTTTDVAYAKLITGLFDLTEIINGQAQLIGPGPAGTYNYFGTNVTGGFIANTSTGTINFSGIYATGLFADVNHFNIIGSSTGIIADADTMIHFTKNVIVGHVGNSVNIISGNYSGDLLTGAMGISGIASNGILNAGLTGYNSATISALTDSCIDGNITGPTGLIGTFYINPASDTIIQDANIIGTTVAGYGNGLVFGGYQVVTGDLQVGSTDFVAGSCQ